MSKRVATWLGSDDTGVSSETIALWLGFGVRRTHSSPPSDPADLGRCLRLLKACPHLKPRFHKMADLDNFWPTYVRRWDEMATSMADEVGIDWSKGRRAERTYELMKQVEIEAYRDAGYEVEISEFGHLRSARLPQEQAA